MVYLDSHKPFIVGGALKAKKKKVGEEAALVIRGPIKRLCEILKGGRVTNCRTLLPNMWLLNHSIGIIRECVRNSESQAPARPPKPLRL